MCANASQTFSNATTNQNRSSWQYNCDLLGTEYKSTVCYSFGIRISGMFRIVIVIRNREPPWRIFFASQCDGTTCIFLILSVSVAVISESLLNNSLVCLPFDFVFSRFPFFTACNSVFFLFSCCCLCTLLTKKKTGFETMRCEAGGWQIIFLLWQIKTK